MVDDKTMREFLLEHGAERRITKDREYWYTWGSRYGLPIGIAYFDMLDMVRRRDTCKAQVILLKKCGMEYLKGAGWFDPTLPVQEFLFHAQAVEYVKEKHKPKDLNGPT